MVDLYLDDIRSTRAKVLVIDLLCASLTAHIKWKRANSPHFMSAQHTNDCHAEKMAEHCHKTVQKLKAANIFALEDFNFWKPRKGPLWNHSPKACLIAHPCCQQSGGGGGGRRGQGLRQGRGRDLAIFLSQCQIYEKNMGLKRDGGPQQWQNYLTNCQDIVLSQRDQQQRRR